MRGSGGGAFDFEVLQTEHFDVHYYPRERAAPLRGRQPLILYATAAEFQQTNVVGGIGEGTGGVWEFDLQPGF